MPQPSQPNPRLQECIENCLECYRTCQQMAITHCLPMGGRHTEPEHFRLMMDCAEICRTAAALMLNASPFHTQTCGVCAEICRACADSCEELDGMEECVRICRECADSCARMSGSAGGQQDRSSQAEQRPQ